ncbi:hypothetical protein EDD68_10444 [Melghiribacillus thermohalophilus]|uniref:Uncharacterized protein n=1 Tax=Melghiribacillus thermohalophilus TaxID=1324956 RepID=A0A4R3N8Q9_9BACI|nr:hypothetical protein [Melghiribacillus thermohalophilus]TCT24977.1 hypothetical protein EDD68_10444 [Melghiribacillus thermohalophilus]
MWVIDRHKQLENKMNQLRNGYTAYAETEELIRLLKRRLKKQNMNVLMDQTENGVWFIPIKEEDMHQEQNQYM